MSCLLSVCMREQDCLPHPPFADFEEAGWVTCGFFFMNYSVSVTLPNYMMTWLTSEALWIDMSVRMERDVRASCAQVINSMGAQMKKGSDQRCWWLMDKDRDGNGNKTLKMLKKDPVRARYVTFFFFSTNRINYNTLNISGVCLYKTVTHSKVLWWVSRLLLQGCHAHSIREDTCPLRLFEPNGFWM